MGALETPHRFGMLVQPRLRLGPNATAAEARDATTKIMAAFAIPANLQQLGATKVFLRSVRQTETDAAGKEPPAHLTISGMRES